MNEIPVRLLGSDEDGERAINLEEGRGLDVLYSRARAAYLTRLS